MTRHTCPYCIPAVSSVRTYPSAKALHQHIRASHPGMPVFVTPQPET